MTKRTKQYNEETLRLIKERKAMIRTIWEAFANSLPSDAPGATCSIPGRQPLKNLYTVFDSLDWEQTAFDVEIHCVPTHPPSITRIEGCTCAFCRRGGIVTFRWSL